MCLYAILHPCILGRHHQPSSKLNSNIQKQVQRTHESTRMCSWCVLHSMHPWENWTFRNSSVTRSQHISILTKMRSKSSCPCEFVLSRQPGKTSLHKKASCILRIEKMPSRCHCHWPISVSWVASLPFRVRTSALADSANASVYDYTTKLKLYYVCNKTVQWAVFSTAKILKLKMAVHILTLKIR